MGFTVCIKSFDLPLSSCAVCY